MHLEPTLELREAGLLAELLAVHLVAGALGSEPFLGELVESRALLIAAHLPVERTHQCLP